MYKKLLFITGLTILNFQYLSADACSDLAYTRATGDTESSLNSQRTQDLLYVCPGDVTCCCSGDILDTFKDDTEDITHNRVNPAMDLLAESLRNQFEASDLKIKELVNLKYVNALYSFYDTDTNSKSSTFTLESDVDGCGTPFVFPIKHHIDRKKLHREGILKQILEVLHHWKNTSDVQTLKNIKELN